MPPENPQDEDDLRQTPPRYGHYGEQYEQSRESHPGIDKPLHHQVELATEES